MTYRTRIGLGLATALLAALLGPSLSAVATHSGNGRATISGRVTDQWGQPLGACVSLFLEESPPHYLDTVLAGLDDGKYVIGRVGPGRYLVQFGDLEHGPTCAFRTSGHFPEWWDDQPTSRTADPIVVGYDQPDVTGIDATLTEIT